MAIIDSYSESNYEFPVAIGNTGYYYRGQVFQGAAVHYILTSASFYVKKNGSPTGNIYAKLYNITGTPGSTAYPTGDAIAVSDAVDVSTLDSSLALQEFVFSGAEQVLIAADAWYAITIYYPVNSVSDFVDVGCDGSPAHAGNFVDDEGTQGTSWRYLSDIDLCFYVNGDIAPPSAQINDSSTILETVQISTSDPNISTVDNSTVSETITADNTVTWSIGVQNVVVVSDINTTVLPNLPHLSFDSIVTTDSGSAQLSWLLHTRNLPLLYAPTAVLSAGFGQSFWVEVKGPVTSCTGNFGGEVEGRGGLATCEGQIAFSVLLALSKVVPTPAGFGVFSSFVESFVGVTVCAAESYSNQIEVFGLSPCNVFTGSLFEEGSLRLSKTAPFFFLMANMHGNGLALSTKSPAWISRELILSEIVGGILNANSPIFFFAFESAQLYAPGIFGYACAPVATMLADTGVGDTDPAEGKDFSRFDSYTLEYTR